MYAEVATGIGLGLGFAIGCEVIGYAKKTVARISEAYQIWKWERKAAKVGLLNLMTGLKDKDIKGGHNG